MTFDPKLIMGGIGSLMIVGAVTSAIITDRHERDLIKAGHCQKVLEALYTPPPTAHTSCYGEGSGPPCSTRYSQPDPYLRSLWHCTDPEGDGRRVEFWRRTAEERGE